MQTDKDTINSFKEAYQAFNKDRVTPAQVKRLFDTLVGAVQRLKRDLNAKIDARLAEIKDGKDGKDGRDGRDGYTPIKGKDYFDGAAGYTPQKGVDYFDGKDADPLDEQAAIEHIERDIPRLGEPIRDSLELLQGDERLDASAIKNLPEATRQIVHAAGHNSLWTLADVNVAGIQPGQSLTWNGIFWEPYTPAGGGGTPVYGEDLTPQGPGSSFTLADTPIAGTVRLYRGGSYQSVPNGDYTIAGDTVTLAIALQEGETLVADYTSA